MTIDEDSKTNKSENGKKRKKIRKTSGDELKLKFESLMNAGENLEIEVRMMDAKLRKLNKKSKKAKVKSILKSHDISKKKKPKNKVAFDLKNIEYI